MARKCSPYFVYILIIILNLIGRFDVFPPKWTTNVSKNSRMYILKKSIFHQVQNLSKHFKKCWKMKFLKTFFHILINIYILEFLESLIVNKNAFFGEIFSLYFCLHRFLCRLFRNMCRVHKFLCSLYRFLNCPYW